MHLACIYLRKTFFIGNYYWLALIFFPFILANEIVISVQKTIQEYTLIIITVFL